MDDGGGQAILREAWPEVTGRPGLTQGRYGAAGNLELVVPAVDDGLWVGWFNRDPVESHAGAALQRWSGALRFARGHRYASADVTQVDAGPDFLEVVARTTGGILRRHVWSPGPGFVDHGELAGAVASCSALVQRPAGGSLHVAVAGLDGRVRVLQGSPGRDYPEMRFEVADPGIAGVVAVDAAWHDDHLDLVTVGGDQLPRPHCPHRASADIGTGPVLAARLVVAPDGSRLLAVLGSDGRATLRRVDDREGDGIDLEVADEFAAAPVRAGGRVECHLVLRRGGQLWHHQTGQAGDGTAEGGRLVEAEVWTDPGVRTVHRG
jgi:hypothetical protein